MSWLVAFGFTQLVEVPIHVLAQRPLGRPPSMRVLAAFAASMWTHPFVWFVFPLLPRTWGCTGSIWCWVQHVVLAELFAVGVEAAWLWRLGVRRPLAWSLLANAASFGLGALLLW